MKRELEAVKVDLCLEWILNPFSRDYYSVTHDRKLSHVNKSCDLMHG